MLAPANHNIVVSDDDLTKMEIESAQLLQRLFATLQIDAENDHNMQDSARRISTMLVREIFSGRYQPRPHLTTFPNVRDLDELYTVGPIAVRSTCSHHFAPIIGQSWIGVIPGKRLLGLSKFCRIVDWIMRRPQLQEEATVQVADELEQLLEPRGIAVVVKARHMCLEWRGVREHETEMTTSVMRGLFRDNSDARGELLALVS